MLTSFHSSIIQNITNHLEWRDVLALKAVNKDTDTSIDFQHIFERMLHQETPEKIVEMSIISYNKQNTDVLDAMLLNMGSYKMQEVEHVLKCYLLKTALGSTRVQNKIQFIDKVVKALKTPKFCIQDRTPLMLYQYMNELSLKMIMQAACLEGEIQVFKYISSLRVPFTNVDILAALMHGKIEIIKEMARMRNKQGLKFKISQKLLIRHWDMHTINIDLFDFIFRCGFATLGRRLAKAMVYTWSIDFGGRQDAMKRVMLLERYAVNNDILRFAMKFCIKKRLMISVCELIDKSHRIVFSPKHVLMIEDDAGFWREHCPQIEYMLVNKINLQNIRNKF